MLCALAMLDAIAAQTNIQVALKWPNDLIYQTRKLGGVLTEASFAGTELAWVVVGLGLNVNVDFAAMPLDEVEQAISLQMILGQSLSRRDLLQAYLQAVEQHYQALQAGQTPFAAWRSKLVTLGRAVMVSGGGEMFAGIAEDVDEAGALLVRKSDGTLQRVLAGDVSLRVHSVS
jgi:BirA family biotin operon repressor/biotin-[acetyl-CoA-carboxylase] ligase